MERYAPTRQNLLLLRGRLSSIEGGLSLLKSKREALLKEFFGLVDEVMVSREDLTGRLNKAQRGLQRGRGFNEEGILSQCYSAKRDLSIDITLKNIWGIKVPEIVEKPMVRSLEARDTSLRGVRGGVLDIARDFESGVDLIIKTASKEAHLTRVGEMIKSDTRKVNAITEVMAPAMRKSIRGIERVLEEREREELFRLKRFKRKASIINRGAGEAVYSAAVESRAEGGSVEGTGRGGGRG